MATYTLTGIRIGYDPDNGFANTSFNAATYSLVTAPGVSTFTYNYVDDSTQIQIPRPNGILDDAFDGVPYVGSSNAYIDRVPWSEGGSTYETVVLFLYINIVEPSFYMFRLDGDPWPDFEDLDAYNQFENDFLGPPFLQVSESSPFGPGKEIPLGAIPNVAITENDRILGGSSDFEFAVGPGDDTVDAGFKPFFQMESDS